MFLELDTLPRRIADDGIKAWGTALEDIREFQFPVEETMRFAKLIKTNVEVRVPSRSGTASKSAASTTVNSSLSSTSCFTSASVMYVLVSVSYSRRFGYFLINRSAVFFVVVM